MKGVDNAVRITSSQKRQNCNKTTLLSEIAHLCTTISVVYA